MPLHVSVMLCMQDESGLWLVFYDEGTSLHSLMYSPAIVEPHHTGDPPSHPAGAPPPAQQLSAHRASAAPGASVMLDQYTGNATST